MISKAQGVDDLVYDSPCGHPRAVKQAISLGMSGGARSNSQKSKVPLSDSRVIREWFIGQFVRVDRATRREAAKHNQGMYKIIT